MIHRLITTWNKTNLMKRIAIGIVLGVVLALVFPKATGIGLLGEFFVGGLRAIAPLLVFALVANASLPTPKRDRDQYEKGHRPLSPRNLCSRLRRCFGQLHLPHHHYPDWKGR